LLTVTGTRVAPPGNAVAPAHPAVFGGSAKFGIGITLSWAVDGEVVGAPLWPVPGLEELQAESSVPHAVSSTTTVVAALGAVARRARSTSAPYRAVPR
jgi:hypothetical protein